MKRGSTLFCILSIISILGLASANLGVNALQERPALISEQISGEAAAAEGFTVGAEQLHPAQFSQWLRFDLGLDAASGESRCAFSLEDIAAYNYGTISYYYVSSGVDCYERPNTGFDEAELPEPWHTLASQAAPGETVSMTARLADWSETWPLNVNGTGLSDFAKERTASVMSLPVPEDTMVEYTLTRDEQGLITGYGREYLSGGDYSIKTITLDDACFTLALRQDGGALYHLCLQSEKGRTQVEITTLRQILSFEGGTKLAQTPDGGLVVFERGEGHMRLVSVSHEGEVLQDTYYSRDFEPGDFNIAAGEGWALCDEGGRIEVYAESDGLYEPQFACEPGASGSYAFSADAGYAVSGERAAVLIPGTDDALLIVADTSGVLSVQHISGTGLAFLHLIHSLTVEAAP